MSNHPTNPNAVNGPPSVGRCGACGATCDECARACKYSAGYGARTDFPKHFRGDLWGLWDTWGKHPGAVLVVTVNASRTNPHGRPLELGQRMGVMGKGCARVAAGRYPDLQRWWSGKLSLGHPGGCWHCTPVDPDPPGTRLDRRIGLLVTKINWWERSTVALVSQGLEELAGWAYDADKAGRDRYVVPLPGAGCGGLDPELSKALCRKYLDSRFVICTPA